MQGRITLSAFCRRSSYSRCVSAARHELAWSTAIHSSSTINRPFSTRRAFEDSLHVGRACSKFQIDPKKAQKWKNKLGKVPPLKLTVPDEFLYSAAPYEVDALAQIHQRSFDCNVLLEIRDVRVPASSHHPSFTRLADHRLHLICYTHADMIDSATRNRVEAWTEKSWPKSRSIFVDTRESRSFALKDKAKATDKEEDGENKVESEEHNEPPTSPYDMLYDSLLNHLETRGGINSALTVGVANTGKSSLLMALLRTARLRGDLPKSGLKKAVVQGKKKKKKKKTMMKVKGTVEIQDKPGKTREITEYLLREKPRAFFLDVPGMTPPRFFFQERPEAWFAFGAANLLPVGKNIERDVAVQAAFCNYVLYALNRDANFGYVAKLGLDGPTLDLQTVLDAAKFPKDNVDPDKMRLQQCQTFLKLFNTGNFGSVVLDDLSKPYQRFIFKDSHFKKKIWTKRRPGGFSNDDDEDSEDEADDDEGGEDDEDAFYR